MIIQSNPTNRTNKMKFSKNEPKPTVKGQFKEGELHFGVIRASGETFMKMQKVNYSSQRCYDLSWCPLYIFG